MKRIITMFLVFVLVGSSSLAFANEKLIDPIVDETEIEQASTRTVQPCPVGGHHSMRPKLRGYINSSPGFPNNPLETEVVMTGNLYVCEHCNLVAIVENNPISSTGLGDYAMAYTPYTVTAFWNLFLIVGHPDQDSYPNCTLENNDDMTGVFDMQSGWYWRLY